jgi:hypothetical protein
MVLVCRAGRVEGVMTLDRDYTHPMREDVKKKSLSPPLAGNQGRGDLHPALPPF